DQRDTRRRVAAIAAGRRCANIFAYTCTFSVVAVAAGAEVVFSVDTAKPCLTTGRRNFELNGLAASRRGKFIQEDARQWMQRQRRKKERDPGAHRLLDLVICDPPVFASARDGGSFALEKEWPVLARGAADLLADDGCAVFANNHQVGNHALYRRQLEDEFAKVSELQALDFPSGRAGAACAVPSGLGKRDKYDVITSVPAS
ncbi:MAG: class I SAM-dependent methyltransferase, partial [bacterium]|nr:class I SAM-dependent methyltransferase [bacterium]